MARGLLPAVSLVAVLIAAGSAWARCNSVSVSVDGTVNPRVSGAMVRVEVLPAAKRGGDSVAVWPDADGNFSASLWYSRLNGGEIFGNDCSRTPQTVLLFLVAGERTLATARLEIPAQFAVDALGNYRAKSRVTLRGDDRSGSNYSVPSAKWRDRGRELSSSLARRDDE